MDSKIEIIYEDKDIIVCHKKPGIAVQAAGVGSRDMVSELKNYLAAGGKKPYLGIVHRLDQPVEGVIVFAKTPMAAANLSSQAAGNTDDTEKGMLKIYHAEVFGHLQKTSGKLRNYLVRNGKDNVSRVSEVKDAEANASAEPAVLDYKLLERREETELLEIRLHTGRHHQIRVQLSYAGCPLVGDRKYASAASAAYNENHNIRTISLKAVRLEFSHPANGQHMVFSI